MCELRNFEYTIMNDYGTVINIQFKIRDEDYKFNSIDDFKKYCNNILLNQDEIPKQDRYTVEKLESVIIDLIETKSIKLISVNYLELKKEAQRFTEHQREKYKVLIDEILQTNLEIVKYNKQWLIDNKEEILDYFKIQKEIDLNKHKDSRKETNKKYYEKRKDKIDKLHKDLGIEKRIRTNLDDMTEEEKIKYKKEKKRELYLKSKMKNEKT